ncbi:hypothetical protein [Campylobacter hyointestinalis]|uniref:Uncharacterized protein n=1 Tax=Campylobacter hyointestinalis subsp. hyointestinalis TaxID=91352 RepID=A0A9W5ANL9_CAMHY|nr:hypothetical protein [Campylobacter hyointestinalis]CUU75237.1 Uncharacterised protein [Campylobacter hyointestinalis subsp. hyointestinalis]CUU82566.1 Uncharacterised protein [Campylobacter hyointestinalis subsp. hyointestinalis]
MDISQKLKKLSKNMQEISRELTSLSLETNSPYIKEKAAELYGSSLIALEWAKATTKVLKAKEAINEYRA